jgi:hypothetical protein
MSANLNIRATELSDAGLDLVSGGAATLALNPVLQEAKQELEASYQKNHPIHLGSFPPPHVAVPHL